MKIPKIPLLITLAALAIVAIIIWSTSSSGMFKSGNLKNSCDRDFLQWCKNNPGAGDYDNFGLTKRECIGQGSYRTCGQVMEALS